jgi:hypothetical protein
LNHQEVTMRVTVFRHVPPLVVGTIGVVPDHGFDACEERLDALEASGVVVERFEPNDAADVIATRPVLERLIATEGERGFPLIVVNDRIVASGRYPSRTEWAHAIGAGRRAGEAAPTR